MRGRGVVQTTALLAVVLCIALADLALAGESLVALLTAPPLAAALLVGWLPTAAVSVAAVGAGFALIAANHVAGTTQEAIRAVGVCAAAALAVGLAWQRQGRETELRRLALHDRLTGLANRALLLEELNLMLAERHRRGSIAVLFIDLDEFKLVNDSYGHTVGDQLLVAVAERLRAVSRGGDVLARFAGDEFVLACPGLAGPAEATRIAQRVHAALGAPLRVGGHPVRARASVGIAVDTDPRIDATTLIRHADRAMYTAKGRGGSRHQHYDHPGRELADIRLEDLELLRAAIAVGDLSVAYQPQVDLTTGEPTAVEALARWHHPHRGWLAPHEFVTLAETSGLIGGLGRYVLTSACREFSAWATSHACLLTLAVNVSAYQFEDELLHATQQALDESGLHPQQLTLEITESALLVETAEVTRLFAALHRMGVRLAVDDFGTGYASLLRLKEVPVDELKIDRSFVVGLTRQGPDAEIVAAVIGMAHGLGLRTVAEGVEYPAQQEALRRLGCTAAQGYLYARPMPAAAVPQWLAGR